MTPLTRMALLAMGATALFILPGCNEPAEFDDEDLGDWTFRCDVLGGCGGGGSGGLTNDKGNTSFLGWIQGEDAFPLNNLPLDGNTFDGVTLTGISASQCIDRAGLVGPGISEANPTVSVDATGMLLPKTMTRVGDPSTACDVYGDYWIGSKWEIDYGDPVPDFSTTLRIDDITIDDDGAPRYEVWLDADPVPDDRSGWLPLCDYAWEESEEGLDFEAYFIPSVGLEPDGGLTTAPNTVFIGCISGAYGKAEYWGYKHFIPEIGVSGLEVAQNAIRAEYCGDNVTHTETGTPIGVQSTFTDEGPDPNAPVGPQWALEAVWSSDPDERAICVGTTRLPANQPATGHGFACSDPSGTIELPVCAPSHLTAAGAIMASWSKLPPA